MRDPLAPVINGFDLSGIVNRYSLQCDQFYTEGDNGGTLLDGSTVTDVLAAKVRLSWTLNSLSTAQYAALNAALNAGTSPDTVNAYVFDPTIDALRLAQFHVTRPPFNFAFDMNAGKMMSYAGGEIVLQEASSVARFAVTPPTNTAYFVGEPLDLSGFSVTRYDNNGVPTDITAQCTTVPADGTILQESDRISVSLPDATFEAYAFDIAVTEEEIIASGDWWKLFRSGRLSIFCVGDMPTLISQPPPWRKYRANITSILIANSVTSIGSGSFWGCANLTNVTIPDNVTSIGAGVFSECTHLSNIRLSDNLVSIPKEAFSGCSSLTSIKIPSSVTSINEGIISVEKGAFYNSGLTSVTIQNSNISYAFWGCTGLTSVTIPSSVTQTTGAFWGCTGLTSVTIQNSNISNAFWECTGLTSVTIPSSVTNITGAFKGCTGLTSVIIPDSVTDIGAEAFSDCIGLTSVSIPDSVTYIGESVFWGCTGLTSVTIPNSVTFINDHVFRECIGLTSVSIHESVHHIYGYAFYDCSNLADVYYSGTQNQWNAITFESGNSALTSATIHYNSTGPT